MIRGLTIVGLSVFVVTLVVSMLVYPGGRWADPQAAGFRPFVNYWCDLMLGTAMNGTPNAPSAVLAKVAFCALAVSLSAYWWIAASLLTSTRSARWAVASGTMSSVCLLLVALSPYDTQHVLHSLTALSAGVLGLAAASVLVFGSLQSRGPFSPWRHVWGFGLIAAALINLVVYVDMVVRGDGDSAVLPVVQGLATIFLVMWMVTTVRDAREVEASSEKFAVVRG